jgi:hypothetical protein
MPLIFFLTPRRCVIQGACNKSVFYFKPLTTYVTHNSENTSRTRLIDSVGYNSIFFYVAVYWTFPHILKCKIIRSHASDLRFHQKIIKTAKIATFDPIRGAELDKRIADLYLTSCVAV